MKTLIRDIIGIFTRKSHQPTILKPELTEEEKAALVPVRTISIGWVSSAAELEREVIRATLDAGAAGYLLSEQTYDESRFLHARATLYA